MTKDIEFDEKTKKKLIEIVLARLDTIPPNHKISIGGHGTFTKGELREHVEKRDEIGKIFIRTQLEFLQSMRKISRIVAGV